MRVGALVLSAHLIVPFDVCLVVTHAKKPSLSCDWLNHYGNVTRELINKISITQSGFVRQR